MSPRKGKALRTAATTRRANNVASPKPTPLHNGKALTDKSASARDWLARRHRVQRSRQ
jgi:hypothetical protein